MEATIACCSSARALLPAAGVSTHQHSTSVVAPSFSSKGLKSSSLFGESLRQVPRSSLKFSTTKQSSHVTKCEIGDSLEEFLAKATPDKGLIRLLLSMGEALRTISFKVRTASCGGTACVNSFGDEQLAVDMLADKLLFEASEARTAKWRGSVGGIVEAPIDKVWSMVSQTKRLAEWMPMVERCTDLAGEEGIPGYVRLVSGFMFPQDDGDRSWIKEKLVSMDSSQHSYAYKLEASNVGLDGSVNSLKLVDYGDESTLVDWSFEVNPVEGAREDSTVDYLGFLYKSCINRIEAALEAASKKV